MFAHTRREARDREQPAAKSLREEQARQEEERAQQKRDELLPEPPTASQGPDRPTHLSGRSWWGVLKRTISEFQKDNLTDWAAALTYYGVLSIFPGLLVLIAALRLSGENTMQRVIDELEQVAPGAVGELMRSAVQNLQQSQSSTASLVAVIGLAAALWSASGYVGAFMRASNTIFDVPEGRPIWKTLPIRLGITVATGLLLIVISLTVVFTGGAARWLGDLIGLGSGAVMVWDIAKWPVLLLLVSLLFAILYWASPNARQGGFRWISPGGILAVVIWVIVSLGFAFYVANFSSYNRTYGSLATVIIFLIWLWISNIAVLLGAEFDAETQRARAISAGHDADKEPYMELRDTRKLDKA